MKPQKPTRDEVLSEEHMRSPKELPVAKAAAVWTREM